MDRMMGSTYTDGQTCNTYEIGRQRIPTHHALSALRRTVSRRAVASNCSPTFCKQQAQTKTAATEPGLTAASEPAQAK